jgi:hypothetical protein
MMTGGYELAAGIFPQVPREDGGLLVEWRRGSGCAPRVCRPHLRVCQAELFRERRGTATYSEGLTLSTYL